MEQYILVAQPDPSHRASGYCLCMWEAKEWYWGQPEEIVKWKGTFSLTNQN